MSIILNEEQRNAFAEAAKPLMQFLSDNCHPHVTVQVDSTSAELFEGVCSFRTKEFIKD